VNCVAALRLVEGELVGRPVEVVAAVLDPVRPRDEKLSAPERTDLELAVPVEDRPPAGLVGADAPADGDDDRTLVARGELDLRAGWSGAVNRGSGGQERAPRSTSRRSQIAPATFASGW
jgi:hypothetical protein